MWATHPPNHEREENALRTYVPSTLDPRPAWVLIRDPADPRRRLTATFCAALGGPKVDPATANTPWRVALDRLVGRSAYRSAYRGLYVDWSPVLHAREAADLCGPVPDGAEGVEAALDASYPPSIERTLAAWRVAAAQVRELGALRRGRASAAGGTLRWEVQDLPASALPGVLVDAKHRRDAAAEALAAHDRAVRAAHRGAARRLGPGWEAWLEGHAALVHDLEHARADLRDAQEAEAFRSGADLGPAPPAPSVPVDGPRMVPGTERHWATESAATAAAARWRRPTVRRKPSAHGSPPASPSARPATGWSGRWHAGWASPGSRPIPPPWAPRPRWRDACAR